jgi:hypothetical protein
MTPIRKAQDKRRMSAGLRRALRAYQAELKTRQRAGACPRCGALAGAKCRSTSGGTGEREGIHWQRKRESATA